MQGFAAGGEVNGAAILGLEQTASAKRGFAGALILSSAGIGAILATSSGVLFTSDGIPKWGWRIPFCLGGLVGVIGFYLRRSLIEETKMTSHAFPLLNVVQSHPLSFLKAIGVGGFLHVPFYIIVGYMNPLLHVKEVITGSELMIINLIVTVFGVIIIPPLGFLADKIGSSRLMTWGAIGQIILSIPIFFVYTEGNLFSIFIAETMLLMFAEAFIAPSHTYLNTLFPRQCRYSGVAFGSCLGTALFGGTTPLFCSYLSQWIGPFWGPSFYLIGLAFIGVWAVSAFSISTLKIHKDEFVFSGFKSRH